MSELEIINMVASSERTPQLAEYWVKRYKKFLEEKLFVISDKTKILLAQTETITSPTTPFGHIDLLRFVNKNKGLEEVALQNTVETAIRFLDSCIDTINFSDDSRQVVIEFRKVGLGVIGFDEYLIAKNATSKEDEINYLGNIISGSAYRASEALAEEKGICGKWNSIKIELRPKPFEFWYDTVNGDIKNGLELMEEFDQNNVEQSNFEIIPRRNSHILLYPTESSWQLWSDRDENLSPKKTISQTEIINIASDDDIKELNNTNLFESSYAEKKTKGLESTKKLLDFGAIVKTGKKVVHEWFMEDSKAEEIIDSNLNKNVGKIDSMLDENSESQIEFGSPNFATFTEPKIAKEEVVNKFAFPKQEEVLRQPLTSFTINDIVKVINKKSELFGNIFQINELEYDEDSKTYLATLDSKQGVMVRDSEIEKLSIEELLTDSKILHEVTAAGVIFSQDGQKVALQKASKLLPQVNKCNIKETLDSQLLFTLNKIYDLTPEFTDISSIIVKQDSIIVAYILTLSSDELSNELAWFGVNEVYDNDSRNLVTVSAEKIRRLQNSIKSKANDLLKEKLKEQVELLKNDYEQKIEEETVSITNSLKSSYDSQLKDLKYKIQEKTKELFDYKESAEIKKSELLGNLKTEYESQIKSLQDQLENLQNSSTILSESKAEFTSQISDLQNIIKAKVNELDETNNILVEKEQLFTQTQNQYEAEIEDLKKQLQVLQTTYNQTLTSNVEYQNKVSQLEKNTLTLEENLKLSDSKLVELNDSYKSQLLEIGEMIDAKHDEYTASLESTKANYEARIEELNSNLDSKHNEIKSIVSSKDNDLKLALDEQNKVRLDLEQMCLARVEQQRQSQLEYETNQNSKFENQSRILATKYDADIQRLEEEFNVILTKKESDYKVNLNRQKQYYEDLIRKMSFNITDSLANSAVMKPIKIHVEEAFEESQPEIKKTVDHSKDDIFQQTRDNLFKPNDGVKIIPITQTADEHTGIINHTASQTNLITKEDTLKTLLRMKGIVARK
jgi:hypothetical protein